MADISQDIYDKSRRVRKLLFQQQRGLGDYELNELQDMLLELRQDLQKHGGFRGPSGDGFSVIAPGTANELTIRAGVLFIDDGVIYLDSDFTLTGLTTPGGARTDKVFAIITQDEKDELTFPDILNPISGNQQALRLVYEVQFAVSENHPAAPPVVPDGAQCIELAVVNRTANATIVQGEIVDRRLDLAFTYHEDEIPGSTGRVTATGGLGIAVEAANVVVAGTSYSVSGTVTTVADDDISYVYIDGAGVRQVSTTNPPDLVAPEAIVTAASGAITSVVDTRNFVSHSQTAERLAELTADLVTLSNEVSAARGTLPSLDQRLDVALNEDGTLKSVGSGSLGALLPSQQVVADMTVLVQAGSANYGNETLDFAGGSSPVFVAPTTNPRIDLLFLNDAGVLEIAQGVEAVSPAPPDHTGKLPIAEVSLIPAQTSIVDGDIRDVRPFLNLGGSGGVGGSFARLQLIANTSIFERGLVDPLDNEDDLDGASNGFLAEPGIYELQPAEILVTGFLTAPAGAPADIVEVGVAVLTVEEITGADLQVEVNKGAGFETVVGFDGVSGFHTFSTGSGNVLNLRITNLSGSTINVEGYGIFYNQDGGPSGDLILESLDDVDQNLSEAIRDINGLRATATAGNPLATLSDIGGGASPLEGKTIVPQPATEKYVHLQTYSNITTQQIFNVDFSSPSGAGTSVITPPVGATHAIVRVDVDIDFDGGAAASGQEWNTYVSAYDASPAVDSHNLVAIASNTPQDTTDTGGNVTTKNGGYSGFSIVELNVPADPTADLSVIVDPQNLVGVADATMGVRIWVEGFLIDELGRSPSPVSFSAFFGGADTQVVPAANNYYIVPGSGGETEFNLGGGFDSANWCFTAPLDGKYAFHASASLTGGAAGEFGIHLNKNPVGNPVTSSDSFVQGSTDEFGAGDTATASVSGIFDLVAGDQVCPTINIANADGGTLGVPRADGRNGTNFQGYLIGVGTLSSATSKTYVFRVNPPTGGQTVPATGETKVAFGAADFDPDGVWDDGTDRFIAQETGFYHFNGEVQTLNQDTATSIEASLRVNGTPILRGTAVNNGTFGNQTSLVGGILELEAGDYVELFAGSSSPTPEPIIGGYFSGFRIANTSAPSPIPFQALVPGTQDLTADQSWQAIDWDVASFDDGAGFNDVANSFSAPSNGKYNIRASISLDQVEPARFVKIRLVLDGSPLLYTQRTVYNGEVGTSVDLEIGTSTLLDLTAGQVITVEGAVSDANSSELKSVETGVFEGYLIT